MILRLIVMHMSQTLPEQFMVEGEQYTLTAGQYAFFSYSNDDHRLGTST